MTKIHFRDNAFDVDAAVIARGFGLGVAEIPALMRTGQISSRCERGETEDAGRYRLTFLHGDKRFYVIVDEDGEVVETVKASALGNLGD